MHFLTIMAISIEPSNHTVPAHAVLPTAFGTFNLHAFVDPKDGAEHALLTVGDLTSAEAPLVRIHSECLTGDAFGSLKCDCGPQLQLAMRTLGNGFQPAMSGTKRRSASVEATLPEGPWFCQ